MTEEFISEPIQPVSGTFHSQSMVKAEPGLPQLMNIYFERQPRSKSQTKKRWWLYTISKES